MISGSVGIKVNESDVHKLPRPLSFPWEHGSKQTWRLDQINKMQMTSPKLIQEPHNYQRKYGTKGKNKWTLAYVTTLSFLGHSFKISFSIVSHPYPVFYKLSNCHFYGSVTTAVSIFSVGKSMAQIVWRSFPGGQSQQHQSARALFVWVTFMGQ